MGRIKELLLADARDGEFETLNSIRQDYREAQKITRQIDIINELKKDAGLNWKDGMTINDALSGVDEDAVDFARRLSELFLNFATITEQNF